ncbi:MAG: SGNH/GDSL hydrolase family protein [Clostridia bacterium]|nr:SGNH/GDSL hydrolase family protein [Clostridia bacterium]
MNDYLILFQGDSITDGNRYKEESTRWDLNHQIGHAYPYVIASLLGALYPEKHYRFINRGVSGDTIAKVYGRWRPDALRHKPDLISLLVGVNDVCQALENGGGSGEKRFDKILRLLLDEALEEKPDTRLVLIEPFLLPSEEKRAEWAERAELMRALQAVTRRAAEDYQAVFVPTQEVFDALLEKREASYWVWDCVHPTEAGHGVIARQWLNKTGFMKL